MKQIKKEVEKAFKESKYPFLKDKMKWYKKFFTKLSYGTGCKNIEINQEYHKWYSDEFRRYQQEQFYEKLKAKGLLNGNSGDIELIKDFVQLYEQEIKESKNSTKLMITGTILLFILSAWGHYSDYIIKEEIKDERIPIYTSIVLGIIFFILIILELYKKLLYEEIINAKIQRYKEIVSLLEEVRVNIKKTTLKNESGL